jgi:hypothetical protein
LIVSRVKYSRDAFVKERLSGVKSAISDIPAFDRFVKRCNHRHGAGLPNLAKAGICPYPVRTNLSKRDNLYRVTKFTKPDFTVTRLKIASAKFGGTDLCAKLKIR